MLSLSLGLSLFYLSQEEEDRDQPRDLVQSGIKKMKNPPTKQINQIQLKHKIDLTVWRIVRILVRHPPTGNYYAIDLSLCHPNIYLDFDWSVCDDLHGSDHFPILIKETESSDDEQHCR